MVGHQRKAASFQPRPGCIDNLFQAMMSRARRGWKSAKTKASVAIARDRVEMLGYWQMPDETRRNIARWI